MKKKFLSIALTLALILSLAPMIAMNAFAAEVSVFSLRCPGAQPHEDILVRVGGRDYIVPTFAWAGVIRENIVNTVNADPDRTVNLEMSSFDNNRAFTVTALTPGVSTNVEIVISNAELAREVVIEMRLFSEFGEEIALLEANVTYGDFEGGAEPPPPPPPPPPVEVVPGELINLVRYRVAGQPDLIPDDDTAATNIASDPDPNDFTYITFSSQNDGNPARHVRNISANAWIPDAQVDFDIADGHWLNFAFAEPVSVSRIEVLERNNSANNAITTLRIEFSDGTEIVDSAFLTSTSAADSNVNVYEFTPKTVEWIRFHIVDAIPAQQFAGNAGSLPGINNIKIWGLPPGAEAGPGNGNGGTTPPAEPFMVEPNTSTVYVNGVQVAFEAYTIFGFNHFKLRDLAAALVGTDKGFDVGWDEATSTISLTSNAVYTPLPTDLQPGDGLPRMAYPNNSIILVDGERVDLVAYTIGGFNFFRLRDLMSIFDIGVGWDGELSVITIDTSIGYTAP